MLLVQLELRKVERYRVDTLFMFLQMRLVTADMLCPDVHWSSVGLLRGSWFRKHELLVESVAQVLQVLATMLVEIVSHLVVTQVALEFGVHH